MVVNNDSAPPGMHCPVGVNLGQQLPHSVSLAQPVAGILQGVLQLLVSLDHSQAGHTYTTSMACTLLHGLQSVAWLALHCMACNLLLSLPAESGFLLCIRLLLMLASNFDR